MRYNEESRLCLEFEDLVPAIMSKAAYDQAKNRGSLVVYGRGGKGSQVLVDFELMPDGYKEKVTEVYGDPYEYASRQPILDAIEPNLEAEEYFRTYILPTGAKLPASDLDINGRDQINYVQRYSQNAAWLDMMVRLTTDKRALKQELNISIGTFWETCTDLVRVKRVNLPANAKRLKEKAKRYAQEGFESLIEVHKFGNDHGAKVQDDEAKAVLMKLLSHKNNFDDTYICATYNNWAKETGREEIVPGTVSYRRKQWRALIQVEREGVQRTSSKLSKQIKRARPSAPLLLVNGDDNVLDAFFRNGEQKWWRPVLYVVIDTFNDYILGYAWGERVTKELIVEAFRDAQRHVQKMTGDAYLWQQLQTDRWGISGKNTTELEAFYNSMATFTPAALKNAQSKYIERSFGTVWHQQLKGCFLDNYSGHNITAKKQINREALDPGLFPDISEADRMIDAFIWSMRMTKRADSDMSRHEEWLQAFGESDKSKKKLMSDEQRLLVFGHAHSHINQITGQGISATIMGERVTYELSQKQIFEHIGKRVQLYYDEHDLTKVLVTDGKGLRFVASQWQTVPAAFADYEAGDADRIRQLQDEKRTLMPMINEIIEKRDRLIERASIDAESLLMAGVMQKEISHTAQRVLTANLPHNPLKEGEFKAQNDAEKGGVCAQIAHQEIIKKPLKPFKQSIYDRM